MVNYTTIQEMFLMNMSVNEGQNETAPNIEHKVFEKISNFLSERELNNWEIVWGPGVYLDPKHPVTSLVNLCYLAYDNSTSRYFFSTAGTNPVYLVELIEDLDVSYTQPWPWNNAGEEVQIAQGSMLALLISNALESNARVHGIPIGVPITVVDYLKQAMSNATTGSYTFHTGGHSLGGALSPLMALCLADTQSDWDPNNAVSDFFSWPSAGPTIGTAGFKAYYNSRIPNTTRIHNLKDTVPHAWNSADLELLKSIYYPSIERMSCVDFLVDRLLKKKENNDYEQAGLTDYPLHGQVDKSKIIQGLPGISFGLQADYQHSGDAYYELLGIKQNVAPAAVNAADVYKRIAYWNAAIERNKAMRKAAQTISQNIEGASTSDTC